MNFDLEKALRYLSGKLNDNPQANLYQLIDETSLKFDLNPQESEYLLRQYLEFRKTNS